MILSNVEIHKALDEQRLVISPEPVPRKPTAGEHCPYDTHSVDLTLGSEISIPRTNLPYSYDLSQRQNLPMLLSQISDTKTLSSNEPFKLERDKFILASTHERVGLPIPQDGTKCLAARIEGKSSWARIGLLVHFTAPTVHPGFEGTLTLEMINLGPAPILLYLGVPIAQLIVEEVIGIPFQKFSQFQGQSTPAGVVKPETETEIGNS